MHNILYPSLYHFHYYKHTLFFFLMIPQPPISTLFPYTTLFRSHSFRSAGIESVMIINLLRARRFTAIYERRFVGHLRMAGKDRKSTRLNSSHTVISYAVFCLKKKKNKD